MWYGRYCSTCKALQNKFKCNPDSVSTPKQNCIMCLEIVVWLFRFQLQFCHYPENRLLKTIPTGCQRSSDECGKKCQSRLHNSHYSTHFWCLHCLTSVVASRWVLRLFVVLEKSSCRLKSANSLKIVWASHMLRCGDYPVITALLARVPFHFYSLV